MLAVGSIVIRVADLSAQCAFWCAALDYVPRDTGADDFVILRPRAGGGPQISLDAVPSPTPLPPRIHLDLYSDDQAGDVRRLVALGAREVHWDGRPDDADYLILEDPEGNRFCIVDTT